MTPTESMHPRPAIECMERDENCAGEVLMRWPGYGGCSWPRCAYHGEKRLEREEQALGRHGNPDSPCEPVGFDPMDAGEVW